MQQLCGEYGFVGEFGGNLVQLGSVLLLLVTKPLAVLCLRVGWLGGTLSPRLQSCFWIDLSVVGTSNHESLAPFTP